MKSSLAVFALGLALLIGQVSLARTLPPPWCPDFSWLVVVGLGLRWPSFVSGLLLSAALGYSMDLLSGSLMGQHALLRILTYLAAALAARQLDLSGGLPVGVFVFAMTLFYGLVTLLMLTSFVAAPWPGLGALGTSLAHGFVNVLAAGLVVRLVERILVRFSDEEVGRRAPLPLGFDRAGLV